MLNQNNSSAITHIFIVDFPFCGKNKNKNLLHAHTRNKMWFFFLKKQHKQNNENILYSLEWRRRRKWTIDKIWMIKQIFFFWISTFYFFLLPKSRYTENAKEKHFPLPNGTYVLNEMKIKNNKFIDTIIYFFFVKLLMTEQDDICHIYYSTSPEIKWKRNGRNKEN